MNIKAFVLGGVAAITAFACLHAGAAQAQVSRIYLAGYLGLNTFGDQEINDNTSLLNGDMELDNAVSFAGALGLRLSKQVRLEGELSYRKPNITNLSTGAVAAPFAVGGEMKQWTGLLNAYYDFDTRWKLTPYVSAGIGMSYFEGTMNAGTPQNFNDSTYALTYQAGAGLKYRPRDNLAYTFGYRYLDTLGLEFDNVEMDYGSHEFRVGLEYDLDWR